jgi:integrase/recombinase XerD
MKYNKEWLTVKEINQLFNYEDLSVRNLHLFQILYYGCLRVSEGLNIRRENLLKEDEECYIILENQKTDKANWEKQPIPNWLYADLIRYCNNEGIRTQDRIIQSRMKKHNSLTRQQGWNIAKRFCKMAGIDKNIGTHTFRRSRITHLIESDQIGDHELIVLTRHSNYNMLIPYKKLAKSRLQKKINELDKR